MGGSGASVRGEENSARLVNAEYYRAVAVGRRDYWSKMAAPRFRVATLLGLVAELMPARVVDLGCGGGELLREIRGALPDAALWGIDLSPAQIALNAAREPSVAWHACDLEREQPLPEEMAASFDLIIASEILEHLEAPAAFLKNARALAAPGRGRLLLSTQSGRVWETERRVGHRRHFSATEVERLLAETGWRALRIWNAGWPFHDLAKRLANIAPERTMWRFSERPYGFWEEALCALLRLAFRFNARTKGAQLFAVAVRE
jgi:2-polyprenyl-3-methyl-5-hydroxy-6-metoxy-1,4-benzoquinol methylase